MEVCPVTGKEVLPCPCGPHLECPEHLLNCLMDAEPEEDEDALELAWAAGFFDGEGCVAAQLPKGCVSLRLKLDVSQKYYRQPLERFKAAVRVGNIYDKANEVYSYNATGADAHAVMELLRPYLGEQSIKTRKYQEALDEGCRPEKQNGWATGRRRRHAAS